MDFTSHLSYIKLTKKPRCILSNLQNDELMEKKCQHIERILFYSV